MSSHVQLEKACTKFGIKPLFGLEGYVAPPNERRKCHQTILAMTQAGYSNLNKLVVESWKTIGRTSKTRFPTIHVVMLEEFSDGLIVLSGCSDSVLACTLFGGKSYGAPGFRFDPEQYRRALGVVEWYQEVFGDRYYLETQRFPALRRTCKINQAYERISRDTGAQLAATSDCHYVYARDNEMQKVLHAAHRGSSVSATEAAWEYNVTLDIPESDERVYQDLLGTGLTEDGALQALSNTGVIADRCDVKLAKVEPLRYPIEGKDWLPWS